MSKLRPGKLLEKLVEAASLPLPGTRQTGRGREADLGLPTSSLMIGCPLDTLDTQNLGYFLPQPQSVQT